MTPDILIVSNRGPKDFVWDEGRWVARPSSGGLVSMLSPLASKPTVSWFCCVSEPPDAALAQEGLSELEIPGTQLLVYVVLAGLAGTLPMELAGAFCVWVSSGLALTGIGLVAWALESRAGPIPLDTPQGRFWDAPALAGRATAPRLSVANAAVARILRMS